MVGVVNDKRRGLSVVPSIGNKRPAVTDGVSFGNSLQKGWKNPHQATISRAVNKGYNKIFKLFIRQLLPIC